MSSRICRLFITPRNFLDSRSLTGITVSEFSVIRCSASSTGSSGHACCVLRRASLRNGVLDHDSLGRYRSRLNDTIPESSPFSTTA